VRLIYPIAQAKWIARVKADGHTLISRRKSPRRGAVEDVFVELVSLPELMLHPNFTLEVALIHEEELRCPATGKRRSRWLRPWRTFNRRLLKVVDRVALSTPDDFRRFIPANVSSPFVKRCSNCTLRPSSHPRRCNSRRKASQPPRVSGLSRVFTPIQPMRFGLVAGCAAIASRDTNSTPIAATTCLRTMNVMFRSRTSLAKILRELTWCGLRSSTVRE
jgi:hypothetical protein